MKKKSGRPKTKNRSPRIFQIDNDLLPWLEHQERSDLINELLQKYKADYEAAYSDLFIHNITCDCRLCQAARATVRERIKKEGLK